MSKARRSRSRSSASGSVESQPSSGRKLAGHRVQEQRGAERAQPLGPLVQLLAAAGADGEVEAASEEAALAAGEPGGQLLGVLGRRGDSRVGQQPALALEPARRLEPRALAAQPLGGERGRDRLDVQGDVGVAGGTQQRRRASRA